MLVTVGSDTSQVDEVCDTGFQAGAEEAAQARPTSGKLFAQAM